MKKNICWSILIPFFTAILFSGCATITDPKNRSKIFAGAAGATAGGIIGILADKEKPLRGAAIGAAVGTLAGLTLKEMQDKAVRDALASEKGKAEYKDQKGNKVVATVVKQPKSRTDCKEVKLVTTDPNGKESVSTEKICETHTTTYTY